MSTIAPCGADCRYAETLACLGDEWIWCTRAGESQRLGRVGHECGDFAPRGPAAPVAVAGKR